MTGGIKQRMARARAAAKKPDDSAYHDVRKLFVRGKLAGTGVHRLSKGSSAESNAWRRAGKFGKFRGNISRDIVRQMKKAADRPPLYEVDVVLWDEDTNASKAQSMNIALLHEDLDDMIKEGPWAHGAQHQATELDQTTNEWARDMGIGGSTPVVGLGLWGDSAVYNARNSIVRILFNILTGLMTPSRRMWMCCLSKKTIVPMRVQRKAHIGTNLAADRLELAMFASWLLPQRTARWSSIRLIRSGRRQTAGKLGKCETTASCLCWVYSSPWWLGVVCIDHRIDELGWDRAKVANVLETFSEQVGRFPIHRCFEVCKLAENSDDT